MISYERWIAYLEGEVEFWKGQQKLAADVAAGIADLDEQAPALRQMLRTERARRTAAEAEVDRLTYALQHSATDAEGGYARAVADLHDLAKYKRWHAHQLVTTGVDHHQWNSTARQVLAGYLEWAATQTPAETHG